MHNNVDLRNNVVGEAVKLALHAPISRSSFRTSDPSSRPTRTLFRPTSRFGTWSYFPKSWGLMKRYSVCSPSSLMDLATSFNCHAKGWMVHSVCRSASVRRNGLPRRRRETSLSDNVVSSTISRFAAASGLASVVSMEPEQTAHLPLYHVIY